jgi:hypothetical protein
MGAKASFSSEWHLRVFVCMSRLAEVIRLIISHTYHFEATHTYHMYQAQLKLNKGSSHVDWPNPSEPIMEIYATDLAGLVFSVTRSSIGHPITRSPIQRPDDPSTRSHDHTIVQRLERCIDGHLLPGVLSKSFWNINIPGTYRWRSRILFLCFLRIDLGKRGVEFLWGDFWMLNLMYLLTAASSLRMPATKKRSISHSGLGKVR